MITHIVCGNVRTGRKVFPGKGNANYIVNRNLVVIGRDTGVERVIEAVEKDIITITRPNNSVRVIILTTLTPKVLSLATQLKKDK